jgi:hypothetical protein
MKKLRSKAAKELATQLRFALANEEFVEVRMFVTYIHGELPHIGKLALYKEHSTEDLSNNIFRGDAADMELDLSFMGLQRTNKRFINILTKSISADWRYLSTQLNLDWNIQGYSDVSSRFDIGELKSILSID